MAGFLDTASSFTDLLGDIVGSSGSTQGTSNVSTKADATANVTGEDRRRLEIEDEAIDKIIRDVLSGPDGLASIFAGEQTAGVFGSNVAAEASGNLASKIVGEIAKLRAEEVMTTDRTQTQERSTQQSSASSVQERDKGLIGAIGDLF